MKIGVMTETFPKLSETFVLNQITGMIDRGHNVSIFSHESADEAIQHPKVQEYNLLNKTNYSKSSSSLPVALLGATWNSIMLTTSVPSSVRAILQAARHQGLQRAGWFTYQARPVLQADLDILHAHFGPVGLQAAKLDQIGAADAFVTMFHGWGIREGEEHGGQIYDDLFNHCDCLLANTKYTREKLIEFGADPETIHIHHVGIDPEKFQFGDQPHSSDSITILSIARLHSVKGLEYGILAVKELSQRLQNVDIQYRIVGGGPLKQDLEHLIQTNNLEDIITLCGPMDRPGVLDELQGAETFLLPSLHEGLPMVLLEAQASGIPIVASNVGGVKEGVSAGESALLVPPRNPHAIADQLEHLACNPSKRDQMGTAGQSNIQDNFDISNLNDELNNIYKSLI